MQFQLIIFTPLLWGIRMTSSLKYAAAYQIQFSGIHYPLQNNHFKWKFSSLVINKRALWCRTTPESALLQICQCSTFAGKFAFCHYCIGTRLLRQSASRLQPWVALFSQTLSLKSQNLRKLKIAVKTFLILQIVVKKLSSSLQIFDSINVWQDGPWTYLDSYRRKGLTDQL